MRYTEFLEDLLTKSEFIDYVKIKGIAIKHEVVEVSKNYYAEPVLLKLFDEYYVTYSVLNKFAEECVFEYIEKVTSNNPLLRFKKLVTNIQS
jgi:hypothetical protein